MLSKQNDGFGHYRSLSNRLSKDIHNGFDSIKNSKLGKFVYNEDPEKFSLYNTHIEGEAIRETKETVKNVATNVYYSIKETPDVLRDKEKRSVWWGANKTKVGCLALGLGVAAVAELGLGYVNKLNLDHQASTLGKGWERSTIQFGAPSTIIDYGKGTASIPIRFDSTLNPHSPKFIIVNGKLNDLQGILDYNLGAKMPQDVEQIVNSVANANAREVIAVQQSAIPAVVFGIASGAAAYDVAKILDKKSDKQTSE